MLRCSTLPANAALLRFAMRKSAKSFRLSGPCLNAEANSWSVMRRRVKKKMNSGNEMSPSPLPSARDRKWAGWVSR